MMYSYDAYISAECNIMMYRKRQNRIRLPKTFLYKIAEDHRQQLRILFFFFGRTRRNCKDALKLIFFFCLDAMGLPIF